MLRRPALALIVAVLLAGAFFYGVLQLFSLGYRAGEVYPPYSSLRADPLGTKVLYAALGDLPGVAVQRNFRALPRLAIEEPITLLYAGVARRAVWTRSELSDFERRVSAGSRAVFAFFPAERAIEEEWDRLKQEEIRKHRDRAVPEKPDEEKPKSKSRLIDDESATLDFHEVGKRWGLAFDYLPAGKQKTFTRMATASDANASEPEVTWHSALFFKELTPEWTTLYTSDGQPVVIERKFGAGSIVLAGDAYFLSNEALRRERHPQLLGRVFAGPPTIVFDEEHLGVREQPGVANLARKYRLHGAVATLALLAALFVWKNAVPFLPPRPDPAAAGIVSGKESAEGFVNLLRRTIPPANLLPACVEEWRKTAVCPPADRARVAEMLAAEQAKSRKQRDPIAAYRAISGALNRRPRNER